MAKTIKLTIAFVIIILCFIGGYYYWKHERLFPNTDDAYVQANVVEISPQVSGDIVSINTSNHAKVKKGQLLFQIDPKPFQIALKKAQANLNNAAQMVEVDTQAIATNKALLAQRQAQLKQAKQNAVRILTLVRKNLYPRAEGDKATNDLQVALAAVKAAQSQLQESIQKRGRIGQMNNQVRIAKSELSQALLNLNYTRIIAPTAGQIENFSLRVGSTVNAFSNVCSLVNTHSWWIAANFKEPDLPRIYPQQTATITIDMYPNHPFHGTVTAISSGSEASFALLPAENTSGNWVKVTQRFPVKIQITNHNSRQYPLRMGASSNVVVDTRHQPS